MPDTGAPQKLTMEIELPLKSKAHRKIFLQSLYWDLPLPWGFSTGNGIVFLLAGSRAKAGFAFCGTDTAHVPQHGAGNNPLAAALQAL